MASRGFRGVKLSGSREWPSEDKHAAFHDRKTAKDQRYDTEDLLAVLTPAVRLFCKRMDGYRMRSTNQNPQACEPLHRTKALQRLREQ